MAEDLLFPRLIYRGAPDTLGKGPHVHPETDAIVGETKRCEHAEQFAADQKDGWRLTREIPEDSAATEAKAAKGKR